MKMKQVLSLDTKTNISRKYNKQSGDLSLLNNWIVDDRGSSNKFGR